VSVRVDGVLKRRFVVTAGQPVVVGRSPDEPESVMLGHWLEEEARSWISRRHLRLELRGEALYVTDTSTNGTVVKRGGGQFTLHRDQSHTLGQDDVLELYEGVEMARSGHWAAGGSVQPSSVMVDAPTIAMRLNL
jgi:predicted component of type VI protein secretion system